MGDIQGIDQFDGIRKHVDEQGEIWYAIVDVIDALVNPVRPGDYWRKIKKRDLAELAPFWREFPMRNKKNNRIYKTECAQQEGILRLVQSIPSPKAEPFKQWLAMTGSRQLDKIKADPIEAEKERMRLLGIPEEEIQLRIDGLLTRSELLTEWDRRGVTRADYKDAMLDELHKGTFEGMTREEHASLKKLEKNDRLGDHMTATESAFANLGKAINIDSIKREQPQGFEENMDLAADSGQTAGRLRKTYEADKGIEVISDQSPLREQPQLPDSSEEEKDS